MILYEENLNEGFLEFGIEIPVLASRAVKTFEFLKSHKIIGPQIDLWHVPKIDEPITQEDLLRVHSNQYVEKLYSNGLEQEIIRTFELIGDQGNYYRYNPDNAALPLTRLFDRTITTVASTVQCGRIALANKFSFGFRGGLPHGGNGYGGGFLIVNSNGNSLPKTLVGGN